MWKQQLKKYKIPKAPGVYIFRGARRKILYIGKATNLRSRVRSYFGKNLPKSRGQLLVKMLESTKSLEWQETDSVLEALILEANLIKKYQPPYNTKDKSDTSFNYIVITSEDYPRILTVRGSELLQTKNYQLKTSFGPFTNATLLKEALKIVRKIFPYRDRCQSTLPDVPSNVEVQTKNKKKSKPCFYNQIGLCPGVCTGEISKRDYAHNLRNIILLFQGKKAGLIKKLKKEMGTASKNQDFELAIDLRNKIFTLEHINDVALIKKDSEIWEHPMSADLRRVEGYDVAHTSLTARVGVMSVIEGGEANKSEYRKFIIKTKGGGDTDALTEILTRRFKHTDWANPSLIVVDGGKQQMNATKKVLREFGYKIPIAAVTKDERHKPKNIIFSTILAQSNEDDILLANAEAHRFALSFHRNRRAKNIK